MEKVAAGRRRAGDGGAGEGVTAAAAFRRVSGGLVGALGGGVRSGLWAAATSMAVVLGSRGGGSRGRRRHQAQIDEKPSVRGRAKEEGNIWGGLLSRVKPPPGTKGPFVPGGGFTRDKRGLLTELTNESQF